MKNYFKFNLTGQKLLPVWLSFLVFFVVPYLVVIYKLKHSQPGYPEISAITTAVIVVLILIAFIISYFFEKLIIESIEHKNSRLVFNGKLGKFMGTLLKEGGLSIITLGFYLPLFIKNIQKFFVENSTYNSDNPTVQKGGGSLFVILTLTLILPLVGITLLWGLLAAANYHQMPILFKVLYQIFLFIMLIPYIYFRYKWAIEIELKDYKVRWRTNFWQSGAKILGQIFLSVITLGIYAPLAALQLYKYFTERIIARSILSHRRFGYDIEPLDDFLFIWGQTLLAIIRGH